MTKQRDGEIGLAIRFELADLFIGDDALGVTVYSAVVRIVYTKGLEVRPFG